VANSPIDTRYRYAYSQWVPYDVTEVRIDGGGGNDRVTAGKVGAGVLPLMTLTEGGVTQTIGGWGHWAIDASTGVLERTARYGEIVLSADGVLTVTGTDAADEIIIGSDWDSRFLFARVNRWGVSFDLTTVREIRVACGAGDDGFDIYNFSTFLRVPVIADGGAGDDSMIGQDNRDMHDNFIRGTYDGIGVTLIGGEGNDYITTLYGDDHLYGGPGEDVLFRWKSRNAVLDGGEGYDLFYYFDPEARGGAVYFRVSAGRWGGDSR
jgi:Ca2+-binding RTX toxin-like protein